MLYKDDWEEAKKRLEAFWNGEMIDRCVVAVRAPKNREKLNRIRKYIEEIRVNDVKRYWTDIDFLLSTQEEIFANTYYGGEAVPIFFVNLGPGILSAYFGSEVKLMPDTVWFGKIIEDWDRDLKLDENNYWLKLTIKLTKAALSEGKDKYFVSTIDIGGTGDVMASLRGTEELCIDLIVRPEAVKKAIQVVTKAWREVFDKLAMLIQINSQGCPSRLLWAPGKHYPLQCDFSALISPAMFDEFFLPEIQELCRYLEFPMYHLDGKEAAESHLESLLNIPELKVIQWVPGAGAPPMKYWLPMLRRIQDAGKSVFIGVNASEIEDLFDYLLPGKTYINTWASSPEEADEIIKLVEKLSFVKRIY